jgi:SAM-dependent methyltransferase
MKAGMESVEYTLMQEVEETMWWYRGLHANILGALAKYAPGFTDLLDAGCGTGGMLKAIHENYPAAHLYGLDISEQACIAAREKSGADVVLGSVDALPHPDRSFDALISLDVLGYDLGVDAAVSGFFRVLKPGGHAVLNLAAYQWMLSYHDRAVGQSHRYTRSGAIKLLEKHGFRITFSTYWNTILFPLMVLQRKLARSTGESDVKPFHPLVNNAFKTCLAIERAFIRSGVPLPFGGSVLIIAQRPQP